MQNHPDDHLAAQFGAMDELDKIAWMVETNGWALEAVPADTASDPPNPGYAYSIGFRAAVDFADVVVFGLMPAAANGLITLVADACRGGTDIPLGVEVIGLLDNELRCMFAPVDLDRWGPLFSTATAWHRGADFEMVQLLYPDRNGFLPYEAGFEQRMTLAQPVIGTV